MPSTKNALVILYLVLSLSVLPYMVFDQFLPQFAHTSGVDFFGIVGFDALLVLVLSVVSLLRSDKL